MLFLKPDEVEQPSSSVLHLMPYFQHVIWAIAALTSAVREARGVIYKRLPFNCNWIVRNLLV